MIKKATAFITVFVAVTFLRASATIINIPDDYPTIQEGIDASTDGDTVLVQPGTYVENINFNGHNIVLGSLFFTTGDTSHISQTIIDGDTSGTVVTFEDQEDSTTAIVGFIIQRGKAAQYGGGIYCSGASPKIAVNRIIHNTVNLSASGDGGGIYCSYSSAVITGNTIRLNEVYNGKGGGIYCLESDLTISNNIISNNSASLGAGIECESSNPTITGNSIAENSVLNLGGGISCVYSSPTIAGNLIRYNYGSGIYLYDSDPVVTGNAICDNAAAEHSGGGIYCSNYSDPTVTNNAIVGNSASQYGGGLCCSANSLPIVTNTIFWLNIAYDGGDQIYAYGTLPAVTYCDVQGGWPGQGNIDADPIFVDPYNDNYNVCAQSPCIDAGDPTIQDPDGTPSDIGIYYPDHPETFLGNIRYVSPTGNDTTGDGSSENPFRTIQHGVDVSHHTDTVLVLNGAYLENVNIHFKNVVLASSYIFSGDQSDIENTVIDGNHLSSVVRFVRSDSPAAVVGLTMVNGGGFLEGSGIYCDNSNLSISSNLIWGNSSVNGGGIYCMDCSARITNCAILRNIATGFFLEGGHGGGIWCGNSDLVIANCTVSENRCLNSYEYYGSGGGLHAVYNSSATVTNTIFWADSASYCPETCGSPLITYSDVQGGWEGEGNIDVDPLFRDPENGDFHLMSAECGHPGNSPCIDAGDPSILDSLLNCSWGLGTILGDMGAYGGGDSVQVSIEERDVAVPKHFALAQNYPNPFNASTIVEYDLPSASSVIIEIYDLLGRRVETVVQGEQPAGYHQIVWDAGDHSSGVYFYRIQAGEYAETRKMVLLK